MEESMRKFLVLILFVIVMAGTLSAETRILRSPDIHGDKIVFVYANDLWLAEEEGGTARRLTTSDGAETNPHFSPDGNWVAFTGQYDGNSDVYLVPVTGGEPKRLTWHPYDDNVRGWTNDGKAVIFASTRKSVPIRFPQFFKIAVTGGFPEQLPIPRIAEGKLSPDGEKMVYQKIEPWESEFRNYRGGQVDPIRIIDLDSYEEEKLPFNGANDQNPVWIKDKIYFLSDEDYTMNIYEYDLQTKGRQQVTFFKTFDCKRLEADNSRLIFENGGYLHTFTPGDESPEKLEITVTGDFPWARTHWENVGDKINNFALSPTGKRALFEARGDIFTVPAEKGDIRNLTRSSGAADRSPAWSPDGDKIAWFSDQSGEYRLVITDQFGVNRKSYELVDPGFYYSLTWSPDGEYLSYTDEGRNLYIFDLDKGKAAYIDNEGYANPGRTIYPEWSPDSKWIAYTRQLENQYNAIFLYSVEKEKSFQITDNMADCKSPAWDASGKYIYFLSSTNYGLNVGWLDMSSFERPVERNIYAVILSDEEDSPYLPESDEEKIEKEKATQDEEDKKEEEVVNVDVDLENIGDRIIALDVPAANYRNLQAGPEGKVYFMREPGPTSSLNPENNATPLLYYDINEKKSGEVIDALKDYCFSHDKQKMLITKGTNNWAICDAGESVDFGDGKISTAEMSMKLEPHKEWRQIFREAWRYQRDYFYVENVHGLDLDWAYDTYSQWLPHVRHRSDLNYILDILGGETSVGHSFTGGGDMPDIERVPVGLLGADLKIENGYYRIQKIYTDETWNPNLKAPLARPGLKIGEGDYILEVNRRKVFADQNIYSFFDKTADKQTVLNISSTPNEKDSREVIVKPVSYDGNLRTRNWVESNRRKVDEISNGKLAYVWLPNTSTAGYNYFNRYYFAQMHKKGAVIDERFNGGGSIADYIVDLMSRELLGFFNNPIGDKAPFRAPNAAIFGPKVMIINESAGSGGDMLPYMFKKRNIGPLVGTRTWGGLVGIWDVPSLIDNGYMTAPRGGFYNTDGEWDVENKGIKPDIKVEMTPKLVNKGHDPQLETAVKTALELLKTQEVKILPQPKDPVKVKRAK